MGNIKNPRFVTGPMHLRNDPLILNRQKPAAVIYNIPF